MEELAIEGFGLANYETAEKKYLKVSTLKKGENVFRILPPMKSQVHTGKWSQYYATHSGYKTPNPNKPESFLYHPFYCIGQPKSFRATITEKCFECEKIKEMTEIRDRANGLEKTAPEKYEQLVSPVAEWLDSHWLDKKHYVNVMLPDRTFQVLKLAHRTKQMIDNIFKSLKENDEIDPTAIDEGVWVIVKQPQVFNEIAIVEIKRKKGGIVELAPLTKEDCKKALEECMDLVEDREKVAKELSSEQIELLTKSSGEAEEIAAIFEGDPKVLRGLKERYKNIKSILDMSKTEFEKELGFDDKIPF